MKKYKLLRHGHCYVNKDGDLVVALLKGNKKHGYQFAAVCCCPVFHLNKLQLLSRIVPNDENWIDIDPPTFNSVAILLSQGYVVKFPANHRTSGERPVIIPKY